jgi:serine protease Do
MWDMSKRWAIARRGVLMVAVAALLVGGGLGISLGSGKVLPAASAGDTAMPAVAAGVPASFADLAEHVGASVVNIKVTKVEKMSGPNFGGPEGIDPNSPLGDFMQKFFGGQMPQGQREQRQQGAGSGFIISKDGYIVTNNHVVEGATEVTVTLANKKEYTAKIIGRDPKTDVAVVKIEPKEPLTVASLGDSDQLRVGEWVVAVGNPFGLSNTVTKGIVSAKNRVIGAGPYDDFIQTDAPINPGNSGGPLFNLKGEVVGINTAIVPNGQGIGFAVAVNTAKALIPQLESKGEVTRGYLGVAIQAITPELAKGLSLTNEKGALVAGVTKGSPAEAAGIKSGDVIVSFDGKDVAEMTTLPALVAATAVDKAVPVTIRRNGTEQTLSVKVGRMPGERAEVAGQTDSPAESVPSKWGLALRDLDARLAKRVGVAPGEGVLVAAVKPDSIAERSGVRPGDVILEVNRHKVTSVAEAQTEAMKQEAGGSLLLLLKRGDASLFAALEQK